MIFISHRANLYGKDPTRENRITSVNECLNLGLHVEIDVWFHNGSFWLGHDKPESIIDEKFLENKKLWCHAKNSAALFRMLDNAKIHCFWHDTDKHTITSNGFIWSFPNCPTNEKSICVLPEKYNTVIENCYGICSDYIHNYISQYG